MRRNLIPILITVFTIVMLAIGWQFLHGFELARTGRVARVANAPSAVYLRLTIRYDKPPVYEEEYRMQDVNGVSTSRYKITGYNGKVITIIAPPDRTYTVSFFFEKLVQDGIWKVTNRPPRGDTTKHYTLYIKQQVQHEQGSRTILFTDPHYWATTAGRQYQIHLNKNKATPDLLKLQSTSLADPRYQQLVNDFLTYGHPSFRTRVTQAQANIRSGR